MPSIVEITALHKSFGPTQVLKGIDLSIEPGEVIAIIGRSGSGKSTLLRCINGLETFDSGAIQVKGKHIDHTSAAAITRRLERPHTAGSL